MKYLGIQWAAILVFIAFFVSMESCTKEPAKTQNIEFSSGSVQVNTDDSVRSQIQKAIEVTGAKLSDDETILVLHYMTEVAKEVDPAYRDYWISLIAIESRFDRNAESSAGAKGLGQVLDSTLAETVKKCNINTKQSKTLINLKASACIFLANVKEFDSIALALAAYNAGKYSQTVKKLKTLNSINSETANYVAKHAIVTEQLAK